MKSPAYSISAKVWLYKGDSPWYFVTIKKAGADKIKKEYIWPRRGFGAIPVQVTVGRTSWKTSVFPDKDDTYLLPLKKEVRLKENIKTGDTVTLTIEIMN